MMRDLMRIRVHYAGDDSDANGGLPGWAIAVIIAGSFVALCILSAILKYCCIKTVSRSEYSSAILRNNAEAVELVEKAFCTDKSIRIRQRSVDEEIHIFRADSRSTHNSDDDIIRALNCIRKANMSNRFITVVTDRQMKLLCVL